MKVLRLELIAFGPFTDAALDLSGGTQGLHIVYGPNEAGKSTALRGLHHLLYGIPERSPDAFRHPFPKMRIGGLLQASDGATLGIMRRKGRAGTLRRPDDQGVVPDSELQRFLNGVDASFFATMFGIGYEDLVTGGTAILEGGGELGRLLFAAGSGSAPLGRVLDELNTEADALFRPSGKNQRINEAASRLKQLRSDLATAQLMGADWARHDRDLRSALETKQELEQGLAEAGKRLSRLQRISDAHPVIAARRETLKSLRAVAGAMLLPEGFTERRGQATTRLRVAESERDQAQSALVALRASLADFGEPQLLLSYAERIEAAHQDLGSQRKAAHDRIGLETRRSTHRTEARRILRSLREDLTLEECDRLRIRKTEAVRIHELGGEYERIIGRIEGTRSRMPELTRGIAAVEASLQSLPVPRPLGELKQHLGEIEPAVTTERQVAGVRAEAHALMQGCADAVAKLGLPLADLREVSRLPVPADETVQLFQDRFARIEHRLSVVDEELQKNGQRLADTAHRLEEARLEHEVPTEADLQSARVERDGIWRSIRCLMRGDAPADATALPDRFEEAVRCADVISDRLRREADRVAAKARLLADVSTLQARQAALLQERDALQDRTQAETAEWEARWQGVPIKAGSPREMGRWRGEFSLLVEKGSRAFERRLQVETMQAEVQAARGAITGALAAFGAATPDQDSLSELVRRARAMVAAEEKAEQRRSELERDRLRLQGEIAAAASRLQSDEADLRRWQREWASAVEPLGIGKDARPAEAGAFMEELKRLFDNLKDAEVLQQRLDGIHRDADAFERKVRVLAAAVADDLVEAPAEEAALELQRRLTTAREAQSRREAVTRQIEDAEARLRRAAGTIAEVQAVLNDMCSEAGCTATAELPQAERRSAERRQLEARVAQENERLLQLGGGAAIDDFIREASEVDPDGIRGEIERLRESIQELTGRRSELDQTIGSERTELGRMDGGERAARIAEDIQSVLGGMERDVEQYARIKIATRVLGDAIERFRERSQGPILRRACTLFRQLTCGSFDGLRADVGSDGRPVIVGLRPGGRETVPVEGMSDGTADQLFLALRLSGLEHYLDSNEAMPFVVDDILIKFDDDRSLAALQALSELSTRTQVIFFTHNRHLLDVAADLPNVIPHTLPSAF